VTVRIDRTGLTVETACRLCVIQALVKSTPIACNPEPVLAPLQMQTGLSNLLLSSTTSSDSSETSPTFILHPPTSNLVQASPKLTDQRIPLRVIQPTDERKSYIGTQLVGLEANEKAQPTKLTRVQKQPNQVEWSQKQHEVRSSQGSKCSEVKFDDLVDSTLVETCDFRPSVPVRIPYMRSNTHSHTRSRPTQNDAQC